jgi:hypothetical protein
MTYYYDFSRHEYYALIAVDSPSPTEAAEIYVRTPSWRS